MNDSIIDDADKRIQYYLKTFSEADTNSKHKNASSSSILDSSSTLSTHHSLIQDVEEANITSK